MQGLREVEESQSLNVVANQEQPNELCLVLPSLSALIARK
jgi:hypothetical protein